MEFRQSLGERIDKRVGTKGLAEFRPCASQLASSTTGRFHRNSRWACAAGTLAPYSDKVLSRAGDTGAQIERTNQAVAENGAHSLVDGKGRIGLPREIDEKGLVLSGVRLDADRDGLAGLAGIESQRPRRG